MMANKLNKMVRGYVEPSWTPDEMADWIDTLGRPYRISTINVLQMHTLKVKCRIWKIM